MNKKNEAIVDQLISKEEFLINKHNAISQVDTPNIYVKDKGGFDYVDEGYMRHLLNQHYPIWKWEVIKYEFIGDKVITVHGRLTVIDNGVERSFDGIDAHRIAVSKRDNSYVDLGNDLKAANSDAFKVAVNRLCNIADDVYRKRIEDISLDKSQLQRIEAKLKKVKDNKVVNKIRKSIEGLTINSKNLEATLRRIDTIIGEQ